MPNDLTQALAGHELYRRNWRYYGKSYRWYKMTQTEGKEQWWVFDKDLWEEIETDAPSGSPLPATSVKARKPE